MIYDASLTAIIIFFSFVGLVLGLSFYLGRKAKSAQGYYAAHGQIHWFVNGIAFAGDYLSAASFLGICGIIAFNGYDGFLYSIGFLAGWIVALFVVAEPLKKLGKFTFADALDSRFNSRGIKLAVAISTLIVSIFYLIPQMVGAGALIQPLLGLSHVQGVLMVGVVVVVIVTTAGMVSTTWVQFIKGSMLVVFCFIVTIMILNRGLSTKPYEGFHVFQTVPLNHFDTKKDGLAVLPAEGPWKDRPYVRVKDEATGRVTVWRIEKDKNLLTEGQSVTTVKAADGSVKKLVNGLPQGKGEGQTDLYPVGNISKLPDGKTETGAVGVTEFFSTLQNSEITVWGDDKTPVVETAADGTALSTKIYFQKITPGEKLMVPGASSLFSGLQGETFDRKKIDFLSLMLALFCGTASLPHILIRYYTVKDESAVRKSTVVGIASIGFFYILTLFLGLGAMVSGTLDVTNNTMSAPLLAKSFGPILFAVISAVAFTTVLGTVSGLILAASGAVAHDLMTNFLRLEMSDHDKVRAGKISAVVVGVLAMVLGIVFEKMNPSFLVGWAFNIAASANLPALVMLLFWKGTTKQGFTAAVVVGMVSSLAWVLLSVEAFTAVYNYPAAKAAEMALVPFSQPAIVTIPLGFMTLIMVSLLTQKTGTAQAVAARTAAGN